MKCNEIKSVFERLGPLCVTAGCDVPRALPQLIRLLDSNPEASISQFSKSIASLNIETNTEASSLSVHELLSLLKGTGDFLKEVGKTSVVKDISLLAASLRPHSSADIADLIAAIITSKKAKQSAPETVVRADVVQSHYRSLERALGDENGFASAFRALESDPNAKTPELIALAKQFSFANVKSRPAALKKIFARHQSLMTSRAKASATAGRIAG